MTARLNALIVAGALASATVACWGDVASAQLPVLTTTTSATTTTTSAPTTTTTAGSTTTTSSGGGTTSTTAGTTTTTVATEAPSSSGSLSINVPAQADLASASIAAGSISGTLGSVQVSDSRGAFVGGWTVTVTSSSFTTGAGSAVETIPASSVYYWSGAATATTGLGTFLPGQGTKALAEDLDDPRTAFAVAAVGATSATWRPGIEVRFPDAVVAGEYEGSVTHSVA